MIGTMANSTAQHNSHKLITGTAFEDKTYREIR